MKKLLLITALSTCIALISNKASAQSNPCKASFTYTDSGKWICANDTVFFTSKIEKCDSLDIKYLWDFGDKSYSSTEVNPYYIFRETPYNLFHYGSVCRGQVRVILVAYHDHGISGHGEYINIAGDPPYSKLKISSKNVAKGTSIDFGVEYIDNDWSIKEYIWDLGDGTTENSRYTSHTYNDIGIYNVCLRVKNQCGSNKICDTIIVY